MQPCAPSNVFHQRNTAHFAAWMLKIYARLQKRRAFSKRENRPNVS
jgi:hypothetical protein